MPVLAERGLLPEVKLPLLSKDFEVVVIAIGLTEGPVGFLFGGFEPLLFQLILKKKKKKKSDTLILKPKFGEKFLQIVEPVSKMQEWFLSTLSYLLSPNLLHSDLERRVFTEELNVTIKLRKDWGLGWDTLDILYGNDCQWVT